jgi:hypothetical protein
MLGKNLSRIEGYRGGDVFECAYARLPEGCGKTVHCSGCTIRNTVIKTFATGINYIRTPAFLFKNSNRKVKKYDLYISTEKVGDIVLLRIDEMSN